MRAFFFVFFIVLYVVPATMMGQTMGNIRGRIIDGETGEGMIGATAVIEGTTVGGVTDIDGNYSIADLKVGMYDVVFSFVSYQNQKVQGIEVKGGETTIIDIKLIPKTQKLDEVVVSAEIIRNSEQSLLLIRKKSPNVLDGISSRALRKIGDSNASTAIKRISGVSVYNGKYVYVRGLGDRYSKTMLNGMDIPGLDPNRNALQIDVFPTKVMENIMVIKSFTADLPADFAGGLVNIETKSFPEEKNIELSVGIGYNPSMHFNPSYLTYQGSSTDFLGFDDGSRNRPIGRFVDTPAPALDDPALEQITRKFNSQMSASKRMSAPNYNLGISIGNQFRVKEITIGYNAALHYRNTTRYYDNMVINAYRKSNQNSLMELEFDRAQTGQLGSNNVLLSGMAGVALKVGHSKFKINYLRIQNGQSRAATYTLQSYISASNTVSLNTLDYSERTIDNLLLEGEHSLMHTMRKGEPLRFKIHWQLSPTISQIKDKDVRQTPYRFEEGRYTIEPSEAGDPIRIWRYLDEQNYAGKLDISMHYKLYSFSSKLRWGISETYKERSFSIDNYRLGVQERGASRTYSGNPDELLEPSSIWTPRRADGTGGEGVYIRGNYEVANSYNARQNVWGAYISNEVNFSQKLKAILGVRLEHFLHIYSGQDQAYASGDIRGGKFFDNSLLINSVQVFPSVNIIHHLTDDMNLRFTYAGTVARPSFKEKSIAQIFDPITDNTFIGNIDLVETYIHNVDLRWEWFQRKGQNLSLSVFYKDFFKPIELVAFQSDPRSFQPRNVDAAKVYGVEVEMRKSLGFITPSLENLSVNVNASYIYSQVNMSDEEYRARQSFERSGETISKVRSLQGQSPFLVNMSLQYSYEGLEAALTYNVQGERLSIVGINANPDVYDSPFHSLNFNITKTWEGKRNIHTRLGLGVNNILGATITSIAKNHGSSDKFFSSREPGRVINLRFSQSF